MIIGREKKRFRIDFVYKIFPVITIYTNKFVPERFGGYNVGFINFIKLIYTLDLGLYEHEKYHSRQFYRNPIKYCLGRWLKYLRFLPDFIKKWSIKKTFEFECEAYAVQLFYLPNKQKWLRTFAYWVVTKYNLKHQFDSLEAEEKIKEYYKKFYG